MLAQVYSGVVCGVEAHPIEIEVNAGHGDPSVIVVGLPDTAVRESKDRVYTALINSGFSPPLGRTTVNLAPANIKKEGPVFDLPIAMGMLCTQDEVEADRLARFGLIGELALSGEVRRVRGVLPIAMTLRRRGVRGILVPADNAAEAAVVEGLDVYPVRTLRQAVEIVSGKRRDRPFRVDRERVYSQSRDAGDDYADVKGQEQARRAIEVAVAGGHNLLMIGPPGTGKTMLAKRIPSILPQMTLVEALEATRIHSIAGTLRPNCSLVTGRPFRSPHHTISDAGLLGGGAHPMPGEVSLAHRGVLFLDELPEFHRNVLEVLRQPLEDGEVTVTRAAASYTFPCRFMLVAAMNPCKCGYYGDRKGRCRCSPNQVHRYRNKISGPLLDRIDIHIEVPAIEYQELTSLERGESSQSIRARVKAARHRQRARFEGTGRGISNAGMTSREVQEHCSLDAAGQSLLKAAVSSLHFSARAFHRILKVARTIADLSGSEEVRAVHISEAIQYRSLDRQIVV